MSNSIGDLIGSINFFDIHKVFLDNAYYDIFFPFLLVFAITFTILQKVSIFKNKKDKPIKPVIMIVSLITTFFGVSFEISPGQTVGTLLMVMIPNISTITMGVLTLYIVGAILGQDFFRGLLEKDTSAYLYFAVGAIGLGAVVFYVGISMGFWNYNALDPNSYWNVVLAVAIFILTIVFLIIGMLVPALILGLVFAAFIYNSGEGNILELFIDPVIFVFVIFLFFISWMNSSDTKLSKKEKLAKELKESEESIQKYIKNNNDKKPNDYESRVFDIMDANFKKKLKNWEKNYGNEAWR